MLLFRFRRCHPVLYLALAARHLGLALAARHLGLALAARHLGLALAARHLGLALAARQIEVIRVWVLVGIRFKQKNCPAASTDP
jgi:hypothetical protein